MNIVSKLLAVGLIMGLAGCQSGQARLPPRALTPTEQCDRDLREHERSLGTLRQYPNALGAYLYSHKPGDKLDYGLCYNSRESLKRDIAIDSWKRNSSPLCQKHFVESQARFEARYYPSEKRKTLQQRIASYNESCSHTSTGQL